jgi:hypothetical protein
MLQAFGDHLNPAGRRRTSPQEGDPGASCPVLRYRQQQAMAMQPVQAPVPPAPVQPAAPTDLVTQLKELAALKEQGILTEEEFAVQKARILRA